MPRRTRGHSYRKKSGVFATPNGWNPIGSGGTRRSVLEAAAIIAAAAKANASRFSTRIPAATSVEGYSEHEAMVVTNGNAAPNAAPFEWGERHPLNYPNQIAAGRNGRSGYWRPQPRRPYMDRAAKSAAETAAEVYGSIEADLLAQEHGYTE